MMYFMNILVLLVSGLTFGIGLAMVWEPINLFLENKYLRALKPLQKIPIK